MRVLFVSNPSSGSTDEKVLERVAKHLAGLGEVTPFTASSGDSFSQELRAVPEPFDLVVVAGGDGTFSRTVNALADRRDDLTFSLIPMGTGNDLATTLALGSDPERIAEGLVTGREISLDLGRVSSNGDTMFFVNACVGGFSVDVDEALEDETKRRLGRFAFWVGGLRAASDIKRYRVRINGHEVDDAVVVGIGNGRTVGGGLELWPDAAPDDGILEGCVVAAPGLTDGVRAALKVKSGRHEDDEGVTMLRGERIEVEAEPAMEMNVDGEIVRLHTPALFDVSGSIRMWVPPAEAS